jgi:hypothetical protein
MQRQAEGRRHHHIDLTCVLNVQGFGDIMVTSPYVASVNHFFHIMGLKNRVFDICVFLLLNIPEQILTNIIWGWVKTLSPW